MNALVAPGSSAMPTVGIVARESARAKPNSGFAPVAPARYTICPRSMPALSDTLPTSTLSLARRTTFALPSRTSTAVKPFTSSE